MLTLSSGERYRDLFGPHLWNTGLERCNAVDRVLYVPSGTKGHLHRRWLTILDQLYTR